MTIFEQMLSRYEIKTKEQERNATYEVMQEITLAGLYRGGFFDKAAFYGGTCLRIFHNIPRFSEDMDFSLIQKTSQLTWKTRVKGRDWYDFEWYVRHNTLLNFEHLQTLF